MITKEKAMQIRKLAMRSVSDTDDAYASTIPEMLQKLTQDGSLIKAGTRINWNGHPKKATVDLWDTTENNPDNAPTLWEDLNYKNGYRVIPEVITATAAFTKGEIGYWNGGLYESIYDANVWNPEQFAAGWKKL